MSVQTGQFNVNRWIFMTGAAWIYCFSVALAQVP